MYVRASFIYMYVHVSKYVYIHVYVYVCGCSKKLNFGSCRRAKRRASATKSVLPTRYSRHAACVISRLWPRQFARSIAPQSVGTTGWWR